VTDRLLAAYPDADCTLEHRTPHELLVATILSAQCTDERVNQVTPALFARYPTPAALAEADIHELETLIHSTGFFRNKARAIKSAMRMVVEEYGGQIPRTMEELLRLPGVARKTANVVLGVAYGIADGVVVDTHVHRLSHRLGFSQQKDPAKVERELMEIVPRDRWIAFSHALILHGRAVCEARKPRCGGCVVRDLCPSALLAGGA
jgi:endonuclease-3